ncbi:MAG: CehA/McbA family metallohydrolase [Myxococcota bacterium]|nr:CehA/McbA family metallohydrolase [Myxococcota bacterium]
MIAPRGPRSPSVPLRIALVGALVGVAPLHACGSPTPRHLDRGDVSVRRVTRTERPLPAGSRTAFEGDWYVESAHVRALVGGPRRPADEHGAILEVATARRGGGDDERRVVPLERLGMRLHVGMHAYRLEVDRMGAIEQGGRAALRVEGRVAAPDRALRFAMHVTAGRAEGVLAVHASVWADDGEDLAPTVRFATRAHWGGAVPFVAGSGPLVDRLWHRTAWVGASEQGASVALGWHDADGKVSGSYERHGTTLLLQSTELLGPVASGTAHGPRKSRVIVATARGGLAEAVRRFGWARGRPWPEVLVRLPYAPQGARVVLREAQTERPWIATEPRPDATALVPLPGEFARSARYVLVASAPGHAPSDPVAVPHAGQAVALDIPRGGRIRVGVREMPGGTPSVARIRLVGEAGTPTPRRDGEGEPIDTTIELDGEGLLHAPPGRYRVLVTRGPVWSMAAESVTVTETYQPHVRAVLERVVDTGEWVACDLHLHAAPSPDSDVAIEERLHTLVAEGIDFAVPTDHNHITDYEPFVRASSVAAVAALRTVPGVEVTTWNPHFGHFNAFPLQPDPNLPGNGAPAWEGQTPASLFAALRARGPDVVIQVNHPRMEGEIGYFERMGLDARTGAAAEGYSEQFDAVEVWNGFDLERLDVLERNVADWLGLLERGVRVVATGSSDSHRVRMQWAGYPRTWVRVPGGREAQAIEVVRALRAGRAFVSSGPFVEAWVNEAGIGETASVGADPVAVRVRIQAPPWMEVTSFDVLADSRIARTVALGSARPRGERTSSAPAPVVRFDDVVPIETEGARFVVVVVRGDRPMTDLLARTVYPFAITNPIWLERASIDAGTADAARDVGASAEGSLSPPR